jgi:multiple sugar transport system substrate-binding protein
VAGKAAIGLIWSNQLAGYQAAMTDQLGATTLPAGGENSYAIQMSQYLGVNKLSQNKRRRRCSSTSSLPAPKRAQYSAPIEAYPSPVVRQAISDQPPRQTRRFTGFTMR